jgi:hypothetical protein
VWEYVFTLRGQVRTFDPKQGMVFISLGPRREWEHEHIRGLGRAFDTAAEVNAYAAAHRWPNWKPLGE